MPWIRRTWLRIVLATCAMVSIDLLALSSGQLLVYRRSLVDALTAISLIFAITTGLILAIMNNYVKGLRDQFVEQARRVRQLACECYDQFADLNHPELKEFLASHIRPLAEKGLREWSRVGEMPALKKDIGVHLDKLLKAEKPPPGLYVFGHRYLVPLEEEVYQLGLLYVRRAVSELHSRTAAGVYYLLTFAVVVIAFGKVAPSTPTIDLIVINAAAAAVVYAILELLFVLSFVLQEVAEESITVEGTVSEDSKTTDQKKESPQ